MARWEHVRFIVRQSGDKIFTRVTQLGPLGAKEGALLLHPSARELELDKDPDQWREMDRTIAQLGSEGWEMVGMFQVHAGSSPDQDEWHFWFKRPYPEG